MNLHDALPFFWLGGFAVCLALHLVFHPQAGVFRHALVWLGRHPAPLIWLTASLILSKWWQHAAQTPPPVTDVTDPAFAPWPWVFLDGLAHAWQQFGVMFHRVVALPSFWPGHWASAMLQALTCAVTQVWFACYLINTRNIFTEEGLSLRQTLIRWPNVLLLAGCLWPWWWIHDQTGAQWTWAKHWFMPEYLVFIAPLPLAIATLRGGFVQAGELSLQWWQQRWHLVASFALTALPILALLHFCLSVIPDLLLRSWPIAKFVLESVLVATIHLWLFVSAALLLLWGGYVEDAPVSPEEA